MRDRLQLLLRVSSAAILSGAGAVLLWWGVHLSKMGEAPGLFYVVAIASLISAVAETVERRPVALALALLAVMPTGLYLTTGGGLVQLSGWLLLVGLVLVAADFAVFRTRPTSRTIG